MGIKVATDIFQRTLGHLFSNMTNIRVCVDDCIIIGSGTFEEHMRDVKEA